MVFVWGQRFYDKVLAHQGSYVVTRFSYFNLVPFIARASYLVAGERALELPSMHRASVRAGYLRTWALVATFAGGAFTTGFGGGVPVAALGLAVCLWAW